MKVRTLSALLLVGIIAAGAFATPISYISATTVPTSFSPLGGDFGLGELTLSGDRPLIVHYIDGSQVPFQGGSISLVSDLKIDASSGGHLAGIFSGGSLALKDSGGNDLLSGTITGLTLSEVFNDVGILAANGTFTATSGSLLADFGYQNGLLYQIVFEVQPAALSDLTVPFVGSSNISLAPIIPEPATIGLLMLGMAGLAAYRRKR
ncbi:MAG TPA: PEP-CTERM sorting domain-containing protein [Planctomycetota bacterium]|nr:PEP-CTERM sorting domain-containing protein [Planctomycetota bacterium]